MTWNARLLDWRIACARNTLEAADILENDLAQPSPVWRLAEALTSLQGRANTQVHPIHSDRLSAARDPAQWACPEAQRDAQSSSRRDAKET